MSELEDALGRAEKELAQTRAAITAARGQTVEELAAKLAALQRETLELEARALVLEDQVAALRADENAKLAELG